MKLRSMVLMIVVFLFGSFVGVYAAKKEKGIDSSLYIGKSKTEAGKALLELAKKRAEDGSFENIAVGRIYYLSGRKAEGQEIFDSITSRKKTEGGDWIRIARIYNEAGEWEKAKAAYEKALQAEPKDAPWMAEYGALLNRKGDRKKAEELFVRSLEIEPKDFWNVLHIAGSYYGVEPR